MTNKDLSGRNLHPSKTEQAELEEWRKWAESWVYDIDNRVNEEEGAGEEGTDELVRKYKKSTPGQDNEHDSR
jgi:hypothetical protein